MTEKKDIASGPRRRKTAISSDIPTPAAIEELPMADCTEEDSRLEKILGRRLTPTEKSAAESMASEHASYGSTRWYLKTLLPVDGPNHLAGIGHEAAAAVLYVNPRRKRTIVAAYSSESHNGPSYVSPFDGAATGIGGMLRDNNAETATKPEACYEARRQGHPLHNPREDPIKRHTDETTRGIAAYGNAMGVPHGDGSIKYHSNFTGNNLVNVMGVSVVEKTRLMSNKVPEKHPASEYVAIYAGKASDKTGIGGTKFASVAIDMTQSDLNEKAVQDPDPHLEEALFRGIEMVVDRAMKDGWKEDMSIKDMGAAGLLCSTVEQLHGKMGVIIKGDLVPQNAPRTSTELLEAETQERMLIYVHENHAPKVLRIFNDVIGLPHINRGAQAAVIGRCNDTGRYVFVRHSLIDVDIPAEDLKAGPLLPRLVREPKSRAQGLPDDSTRLEKKIEAVLASINFKNDGYVHDHYDKHVRSTNIVNRGQGCAPLRTHPLLEGKVGYSVSFDSNAVYGLLDPKFQAEDSFVRGAYKLAAAGCSVIGVTNNANYGRMNIPEEMWEFVKGQEGVARACVNWKLEQDYLDMIAQDPVIKEKLRQDGRRHVTVNSGNCSVNKANANTGTAIPPTAILGVVGWTDTPQHHATWDIKPEESTLYLIGARQEALGGTDYLQALHGPECLGDKLFTIDYGTANKEVEAIIRAVRKGIVAAANNIEEGGLCNAVAEMIANTKAPVDVSLYVNARMSSRRLDPVYNLFSESHGMVLQVPESKREEFMALMERQGVCAYGIGKVSSTEEGQGKLSFTSIFQQDSTAITFKQGAVQTVYHAKLDCLLDGKPLPSLTAGGCP